MDKDNGVFRSRGWGVLCHLVGVMACFSLMIGVPVYANNLSSSQPKVDLVQAHESSSGKYKNLTCPDRVKAKIDGYKRHASGLQTGSRFRLAVLEGDVEKVGQLVPSLPGGDKHHESGGRSFQAAMDRREILQVALDDAALTGDVDMIERLIALGADPNIITKHPKNPAIMVAAGCGNLAALDALYEAGADVSLPTFFPISMKSPLNAIEIAVFFSRDATVNWLLLHGANACRGNAPKRISLYIKYRWKGYPPLPEKTIAALRCPASGASRRAAEPAGS